MCGKRFINNSEVAEMRTALKRMTAEDLELARESGGTAFQIQGLIGEDHLFDSLSFLESEQQNTCKRPIRYETDLQIYWDKAFCGPRQYTLKAIIVSKFEARH